MMNDRLYEMLKMQEAFQRELGFYFNDDEMSEEERVIYATEMIVALLDETHEALHEISWKAWASSTFFNRDAFVGELVDVFHFFMNLCLVANVSADELYSRYTAKREINRERQAAGYDGVSTKCSECGRALDDESTLCTKDKCVEH